MASKKQKAKELQAATNSNNLEEIKDLFSAKFSELGTRLTSLEEKLNNVTNDIDHKLSAVETTDQEASTYAQYKIELLSCAQYKIGLSNYHTSSVRY